jgi:hypothetical protein
MHHSGGLRRGIADVCLKLFRLFENGIGGKLMECERALLCVVPAHAGTHNHRSLLEQKPLATLP